MPFVQVFCDHSSIRERIAQLLDQSERGERELASRTTAELLGVAPPTATQYAQHLTEQLQAAPELREELQQLESLLTGGRANDAVDLLHRSFGANGPALIACLASLRRQASRRS